MTIIPQIDEKRENNPGQLNKKNKSYKHVGNIVGNQLATGSDSVTVNRKRKRKNDEIIFSDGATNDVSKGRLCTTTEGGQSAP